MGGKKKLSLKQMERTQTKKDDEKPAKTDTKSATDFKKEKKTLNIVMPDPRSDKIVGEVKKMRVLTPYTVASRFDLRISVAKDFLEELEKQGVVKLVSQSRSTRVYSVAA